MQRSKFHNQILKQRLDQARLYTFVDTGYLQGREPIDLAKALIDGGADLIQLRAKNWGPDQIARVGEALLRVTEPAGVLLVINDWPEIAAQIGAPLAHLGQEEFFGGGYRHIRELISNPPPWIGLSTHAPEEAQRAIEAGAVYIAIGPVFATPTKPGRHPIGLQYVQWAAQHLKVPWFAIGGITLDNVDQVLEVGARRIAVVSAILNHPDVAGACQAFRNRLEAYSLS